MAITYTTKKYRILQKTSATTADIMHPETEAEITLIKPISGIEANNAQKALEKLNDKINIVNASILYGTKEYWNDQPSLRTEANTIYVYTNAFDYYDIVDIDASTFTTDGSLYIKVGNTYQKITSGTYDESQTYYKYHIVAGMKIGDGNAYLKDKAFITDYLSYKIDELRSQFEAHASNTTIHVNNIDRQRWDDKMNYEDEIVNETLVINRN